MAGLGGLGFAGDLSVGRSGGAGAFSGTAVVDVVRFSGVFSWSRRRGAGRCFVDLTAAASGDGGRSRGGAVGSEGMMIDGRLLAFSIAGKTVWRRVMSLPAMATAVFTTTSSVVTDGLLQVLLLGVAAFPLLLACSDPLTHAPSGPVTAVAMSPFLVVAIEKETFSPWAREGTDFFRLFFLILEEWM